MKKMMILLITLSSIIYGAERVIEHEKLLSVPYKGTLIQVMKGTISRHIEQPTFDPGVIIIGKNEQRKLQQANVGDSTQVGQVCLSQNNIIFIKHRGCDSGSDDDMYKPFIPGIKKSWKDAYAKKYDGCSIVAVEEPKIEFTFFKDDAPQQYRYLLKRADTEDKDFFHELEFFDAEALQEAKKDLAICYENALYTGTTILAYMHDKTIAIDPLGTAVGFPREDAACVTVKTVLEFIEHNPHAYALIQLFVKKRSEFNLYKKLFGPWLDEQ